MNCEQCGETFWGDDRCTVCESYYVHLDQSENELLEVGVGSDYFETDGSEFSEENIRQDVPLKLKNDFLWHIKKESPCGKFL